MRPSPVNYPLVVVPRTNPLIKHYADCMMRRAFVARDKLKKQIANVRTINQPLGDDFPELTQQIAAMLVRVRNLRRGVPATESLSAPQQSESGRTKVSEAETFLLKKAYRKASWLCHPDRGGKHEEFVMVTDAYHAGDLNSLNAFVLSKQENTEEMVQHWRRDAERCKIAWVEFQSTPEFALATLIQRGNYPLAASFFEKLLYEELYRLHCEEEELLTPRGGEGASP